jgi:hypothetical protein
LVEIDAEGYRKVISTKLFKLGIGELILDFRFWPQEEGIRRWTIVLVGESGTLHLFVFPIDVDDSVLSPKEQQTLSQFKEYEFNKYVTLESKVGSCQGIELSCPPEVDFILLFRRFSMRDQGKECGIAVSALVETETDFVERGIFQIRGEPNKPVPFEIPHNCMVNGKFHFWRGDKLNLANLTPHITYLKELLERTSSIPKFPSQKFEVSVLLEVPLPILKFLSVEYSGIKILRRAENTQQYKY